MAVETGMGSERFGKADSFSAVGASSSSLYRVKIEGKFNDVNPRGVACLIYPRRPAVSAASRWEQTALEKC